MMALGWAALDAMPLEFVERTMRIERLCGDG
jgi:hypothetical protein